MLPAQTNMNPPKRARPVGSSIPNDFLNWSITGIEANATAIITANQNHGHTPNRNTAPQC